MPCAERIQSPYDTQARYSSKGSVNWVGYKVHLTETCDEDSPHLICQVETTNGTVQDVEVVPAIHSDLNDLNCLPKQQLLDMGYNSAGLFRDSQLKYGIELISPRRLPRSWQAKENKGFALADFQIDWERQVATCPMGKESSSWTPGTKRQGYDVFYIKFREPDCRVCAARSACTRAKRRTISVQTLELYDLIQEQQNFQASESFRELYKKRAGVEGTIAQAAWVLGMRRSRYLGLAKPICSMSSRQQQLT